MTDLSKSIYKTHLYIRDTNSYSAYFWGFIWYHNSLLNLKNIVKMKIIYAIFFQIFEIISIT